MTDPVDPDRTKVTVVDLFAGKVLDNRYRIEYRLATGGFGAVYRARHAINGREVAIKILHSKYVTDPSVAARFRREAAALGQMKSAHMVTAFDFGETADGVLYIVMELLSGQSLYEQYRAHGALPWRRVVEIVKQVCIALAEAHARGIVHRDLKPQNIHLEQRGAKQDFVKVLDFGIAKVLQGSALDAQGITHAGQVIGTFDYMAPEQLVGGEISVRSDLYTVGILLFEMIAGDHPFGVHGTPAAQLSAILAAPAPVLSQRVAVPPELDAIVSKCLQWEPIHRYASADQLRVDLERALLADEGSLTHLTRPDLMHGEEATGTWISSPPAPPRPVAKPSSPPSEPDLFSTIKGVGPPKRKR